MLPFADRLVMFVRPLIRSLSSLTRIVVGGGLVILAVPHAAGQERGSVMEAATAGVVQAGADRATRLMHEGREAYAARDYEAAARAFERATEEDPERAEAFYELARVLYDPDNPNRDESRADGAIDKANDLDPRNLRYMTAALQQLRSESWNFLIDFVKQQRRVSLARAILEIDSTNALAHEELGSFYIRDYYEYRNAISLPNLSFYSPSRLDRLNPARTGEPATPSPGGEGPGREPRPGDNPEAPQPESRPPESFNAGMAQLGEVGDIGVGDRFNLDQLESQGAARLDLARRADAAYRRAIDHLEAAVDHDPRRRSAYDHLMRIRALADDYDEALPMLREMLTQFGDDPASWLYTGLANHRLGREEAADKAFREALDRMDPDMRNAFQDVSFLQENRGGAASGEEFWTTRDPRFLTPANERRSEHYARLTYADLLYRSEDLNMPGWETQRGRIHVRYGQPRRDVVIVGDFQAALESYVDRVPENAVGSTDFGNLSQQVVSQANRFNIWDYGDFQFVFEDPLRNGEFRLYSPPADLFSLVSAGNIEEMDYVIKARETFRRTPERYEYEPPGRRVELPYRVTAFKGEGGRTDLYVHYGVPLTGEVAPVNGTFEVTLKTGAFLIGDADDLVAERRRTRYGLREAQVVAFDSVRLWTDTEAMSTQPGSPTVSLEFETAGGSASAVQRREVNVPAFSRSELQMSDVMLAYLVEEADGQQPGRAMRDGLSIHAAPWGVFGTDQPLYLYFETYNLSAAPDGRTDYEVEAQLRPKDEGGGIGGFLRRLFGGGEPGVATSFPVQGNRTDDTQYLILDTEGQAPGLYTLTVRIRDRISGATVEKETTLFLEGGD